jgi:hypothetical protein
MARQRRVRSPGRCQEIAGQRPQRQRPRGPLARARGLTRRCSRGRGAKSHMPNICTRSGAATLSRCCLLLRFRVLVPSARLVSPDLPHGTCPLKREGRPPGPAGYVKPEVSLRAFGQQPRLEGSRSYRDVRVTERGAKATALRRVCLRRRNGRLRCIAGRGRPAQQHARLECGRAVVGDEPRAEFRVNVAGTACDKRIADRSS